MMIMRYINFICCYTIENDPYSPTGGQYVKVFAAECGSGDEIRMYDGGGDNPGSTVEEQAFECAKACLTKQKRSATETKSWNGFIPKGFVVAPGGKHYGRCYCEDADSSNCPQESSGIQYIRYDFKRRKLPTE